jgi:hypothetical protein
MRVEYFTTLAKLGLGKEEYFTSVLISRVCLVKTLKRLKLPELKDTSEMIINNTMREYEPISLFYTPFHLFPFK